MPKQDPHRAEDDLIETGKFKFPIPRWSVHLLGIIAVVGIGYTYLSGPIRNLVGTYNVGKATSQDQSLAYHTWGETPMLTASTEGDLGILEARLFFQEDCVSVLWKKKNGNGTPRPHFICGITHEDQQPSPGNVTGQNDLTPPSPSAGVFAGFAPYIDGRRPSLSTLSTSKVQDNGISPGLSGASAASPQAHCLNPHPGAFQSSYGQQNGCWVQVWRRFGDRCTHYQWFNTCGGNWDVNPDGSPRIFWTECYH